MTTPASHQATSQTTTEANIPNATNARGGLLTTRRRNKVASSSMSIDDEKKIGDFGCEVVVQHDDHVKVEDGTKNELHVLK